MTPVIVNLTCWTVTVLAIGSYFALMPAQRRKQAMAREWERLQRPAQTFPGIVWGCARWRKCSERRIETPPYADDPPYGRCHDHGLRMDVKVVEHRVISGGPDGG